MELPVITENSNEVVLGSNSCSLGVPPPEGSCWRIGQHPDRACEAAAFWHSSCLSPGSGGGHTGKPHGALRKCIFGAKDEKMSFRSRERKAFGPLWCHQPVTAYIYLWALAGSSEAQSLIWGQTHQLPNVTQYSAFLSFLSWSQHFFIYSFSAADFYILICGSQLLHHMRISHKSPHHRPVNRDKWAHTYICICIYIYIYILH